MKKPLLFLLVFLFWVGACARRPVNPPEAPAPELLREGLASPAAFALDPPETYFVAEKGEEGTWRVVTIRRAKTEELLRLSSAPTALGYDPRHGRLFVAEPGVLKVYAVGGFLGLLPAKKTIAPPKEISLPEAGEIPSVAYSLMNSKVYLCSPSARKVFSVDPSRGKVEEVLGAEALDSARLGQPRYLLPSSDGTRIYLIASRPEGEPADPGSAIATYRLKTRAFESVHPLPFSEPVGLEFYRSHFVTADRLTGDLYALPHRDGGGGKLPVPAGWGGPVTAFSMDLDRAAFLVPEQETGNGRLVRLKAFVKE